jgi:hypothetical protein
LSHHHFSSWSYGKVDEDVFSTLVCDGKISIHMNGEILEFNSLLVEEDTWYNIALVWNNDTRLLSAYLIRDDLQMSSEILLIPDDEPNPIRPGGKMMMGQWNYPESHTSVEKTSSSTLYDHTV